MINKKNYLGSGLESEDYRIPFNFQRHQRTLPKDPSKISYHVRKPFENFHQKTPKSDEYIDENSDEKAKVNDNRKLSGPVDDENKPRDQDELEKRVPLGYTGKTGNLDFLKVFSRKTLKSVEEAQ